MNWNDNLTEINTLYIIGNGFDLAHGMNTRYVDFRRWLVENGRIDVIEELQSAYPSRIGGDFLLWSDFETALGQYDIDKVINWSWEDLFLTHFSIGGRRFDSPNFFLETQLNHIINSVFSEWVRHIQLAVKAVFQLSLDAQYITFNYTDTLEVLYHIPEQQILHIHGRASKGEDLIVGHNRQIDHRDFWNDSIDMRENNERMQRLCDMNDLCKPFNEIIKRNEVFFQSLGSVRNIYVRGHSCGEIDYPYFRKIKTSVAAGAHWHFYPYTEDDARRIGKLKEAIGIQK